MKINATEIRVGMILEYKNDLWEVLKTQHVKPGKGGAFAQVEMKSLNKNTKLNERFRSSETVEKAILEETKFNFLYEDDENYYFINVKTFDQINIKEGETSKSFIIKGQGQINTNLSYTIERQILKTNAIKRKMINQEYLMAVKRLNLEHNLLKAKIRFQQAEATQALERYKIENQG